MSDNQTPQPGLIPGAGALFVPPFPDIAQMQIHANLAIQVLGNHTGYSLAQLAAMFRMAASACDENGMLLERIEMMRRLRR